MLRLFARAMMTSSAVVAARLDLRFDFLKPTVPPEAHAIASPFSRVSVTIVLLNVVFTHRMPRRTLSADVDSARRVEKRSAPSTPIAMRDEGWGTTTARTRWRIAEFIREPSRKRIKTRMAAALGRQSMVALLVLVPLAPLGADDTAELCAVVQRRMVERPFAAEDRPYHVHLPPSVCASRTPRATPVVLTLACFHCKVETVPRAFYDVADAFGFALLAGTQLDESWNAGECCGDSRDRARDDSSYLARALAHALDTIHTLNAEAILAFGWSNGGFFATTLAHTSTLLAGLATAAGYTSRFLRELPDGRLNASLARPTPVMLHHARDDGIVRFEGCCKAQLERGPAAACCCQMSELSEKCVSAGGAWEAWAVANGCQVGAARHAPSSASATHAPLAWAPPRAALLTLDRKAARCLTFAGCAANTTLCVHKGKRHFLKPGGLAKSLAMTRDVGLFFARTACELHGRWVDDAMPGAEPDAGGACRCAAAAAGEPHRRHGHALLTQLNDGDRRRPGPLVGRYCLRADGGPEVKAYGVRVFSRVAAA